MSGASSYQGSGLSHVGQRANNEDAFFTDDALGLYIVADGVGGKDAGEVASRIVCEIVPERIRAGVALSEAAREAHFAIANAVAQGEGRPGMASTIVALLIRSDKYEIAWLGDSRIYIWDGQLKLLSRDHSLVETLIANGEIDLEQAQSHPKKNVILAALGGGDANINVGQNGGVLRSGTRFLLCSDGLTDIVMPKRVAEILNSKNPTAIVCELLVEEAVAGGGRDNITAVVVDILAAPIDASESDEYADTVRTYDPISGAHTYHPVGGVRVSSKVRKLADASEMEISEGTAEQGHTKLEVAEAPWEKLLIAGVVIFAALVTYLVLR
jgi:serine/threonine protein phosphatase PrpC